MFGPIRTGRGTCLERAISGPSGGRRRYDAASPEPMSRAGKPARRSKYKRSSPEGKLKLASRRLRDRRQRGAVEYVRLAGLDRHQTEGAHRLDEDHDARDDRRRAVGVEACDLAPFGLRERRQGSQRALAGGQMELVAMYPIRVIGVELLIDRRDRR